MPFPHTILCLDLGTTTGWAVLAQGQMTSGVMSFACDRYSGGGMRFLRFRKWLDEMKALNLDNAFLSGNNGIGEVYFEEVRRHLKTDASHVYGGFMAHLTAWCEQESVPYEGVPVGTIKKFMTGNGSASKEMMLKAVQSKGHKVTDHNEADALSLLYWRLNYAT